MIPRTGYATKISKPPSVVMLGRDITAPTQPSRKEMAGTLKIAGMLTTVGLEGLAFNESEMFGTHMVNVVLFVVKILSRSFCRVVFLNASDSI